MNAGREVNAEKKKNAPLIGCQIEYKLEDDSLTALA